MEMLTPRWHKVIRDLWSNKTKTILVVLAIAVGLFAFGSVFITQEILVTSMDEQYRATNSSNIVFNTDSFDESLLRWIREQPEVGQVQGKASYMLKMYGGDKTYNLTLIAYDDNNNISMNKVTPEKGVWPPARKEIAFERSSLPLTQVQVGDTVTVELSSGKRYDLTISGTVHDLNAFPGTMVPLPTAYVSWQTLEYLGFSGQSNQINIVTKENITDIPSLEIVASTLKQRLEDRGFTVYSTQVKNASEHWAKSVTQSFVLILTGLGIFSLILSGFLVVNTITALIAQQKRQIGMMKAVGGTGRQIISLYLVLVTCYGLLALLLAIPISLGLGYFFMTMVANLLNIDITGFHMPFTVLMLEFGAAVLIPAIAAGLPILGGVKMSVREALSDYGLSGKTKTGFFDRTLLKINILSRPLLLSLRNTFRRKGRLALTMGTLILAGTLFIGVMNIRASLDYEFSNVFNKYYDWEVALGLDGSYPVHGIETRTLNIPGVTGVESQAYAGAQRIKPDGTRGASFNLTGINLDSTFVSPEIKSGRWIEKGDKNALVLTSGLAKNWPDVNIGDTVTLKIKDQDRDWVIVGLITQEWENTAYADFGYLSRINGTPGLTSALYIKTAQKDGDSQTAMAESVESQLKKSGIKVGSSITQNAIVSSNAGQVDFLIYFLLIMAILSAIIGALGLMGMMSLNVLERTREIGVMRSIGAKSASIGWIVITEGLIIGIVSWLIAIPVSVPMTMVFNSLMGSLMFGAALSFVFSPLGLFVWLAIVLVMAFIASLLPAYRAMRMSVRETLAYE
jgi:putative ABC transport system permease protein